MSNRFGRNQRRRARVVEAELAATRLALGQAVTGMFAVGDPSRGFPLLSSLGMIRSFDHRHRVDYRWKERTADVTLTIWEFAKFVRLMESAHAPIVSWLGILWQITDTTMPRDGEYVGGPPQVDLKLNAIWFRGDAADVMPMTAARWNELRIEVMNHAG